MSKPELLVPSKFHSYTIFLILFEDIIIQGSLDSFCSSASSYFISGSKFSQSPIFPSLTSILLPKSFWTWPNGSPDYFPLASLLSYCIHLTSLQLFSILLHTPYLVKKKSNHITSLLSIYLSIIICNKTQISRMVDF